MAKTTDGSSPDGSHPYDDFQVGDQVRHPKWGVGTILFRSGAGEGTKVIVVFQDEGQKKLALKFAKLKKLQDAKPAVVEAPVPVPVEAPAKAAKGEDDDEELEEELAGDEPEDDEKILPTAEEEEEIAFGDDEEEISEFEEEERDGE